MYIEYVVFFVKVKGQHRIDDCAIVRAKDKDEAISVTKSHQWPTLPSIDSGSANLQVIIKSVFTMDEFRSKRYIDAEKIRDPYESPVKVFKRTKGKQSSGGAGFIRRRKRLGRSSYHF